MLFKHSWENFQIYGVQITGKCIFESKKLKVDFFIYAHRQNSPLGSNHHPSHYVERNYLFPQAAFS